MAKRRPAVDIHRTSREHRSMVPSGKLRMYIETSVWNFYFADDARERRDVTRDLFHKMEHTEHELFLSNLVLREIEAAPEPRRSDLGGLVARLNPTVLLPDVESDLLAETFLDNGVIPPKYVEDAVHVAIALTNGMDVLLSWNFKHIVKLKTRRFVSATCRRSGYNELEICTPEEVLFDD